MWESSLENDSYNGKQQRIDYRGDFGLREGGKLSDLRLEVIFNENVDEPELKVLLPVIKGLTIFSPADRISVPHYHLTFFKCISLVSSWGAYREPESPDEIREEWGSTVSRVN